MTLPNELILEKNKLSNASPWIMLLDIHLTPSTGVLRLTSDTEEVTFGGNLYSPFPMQLNQVPQSLSGDIPEITIVVGNQDQVVQGYVEGLNGAVDCDVTMYVVHKGNLSVDYTDLERHFKIMSTVCDNNFVVFTLGLISPTQRRFPLYRTMGNHCNWIFKGAECGYSGATDECDHTLYKCQLLNGSYIVGKAGVIVLVGAPRFGGFPGLISSGVKFA